MSAPVSPFVRSAVEVEGWRAQAEWELREWGARSPYVTASREAALEAFAWLAGRALVAPATGVARDPDERAVVEEMRRAEALEQEDGDARMGRIGRVLSWFLKDPDTESPL